MTRANEMCGVWVQAKHTNDDYYEYHCSCCDRHLYTIITPDWVPRLFPYCHCGAKMEACKELNDSSDIRGCEWCTPDANGEYGMIRYTSHRNPKQYATMFVYGGKIAVDMHIRKNRKSERLVMHTNYCPMCGRKFDDKIDVLSKNGCG